MATVRLPSRSVTPKGTRVSGTVRAAVPRDAVKGSGGGRDVTPPERARGTAAASRGYPKQSHLGSQRQGNGERHRKDTEERSHEVSPVASLASVSSVHLPGSVNSVPESHRRHEWSHGHGAAQKSSYCESTQSTASTVATLSSVLGDEHSTWKACQEWELWSHSIVQAVQSNSALPAPPMDSVTALATSSPLRRVLEASAKAAAALARQGAATTSKLEELEQEREDLLSHVEKYKKSAEKSAAKVQELSSRCDELHASLADCEELRTQELRQAQHDAELAQRKRQQLLLALEELIHSSSPVARRIPQGETSAPPRTRFPFQLPVDELDVVEAAQELGSPCSTDLQGEDEEVVVPKTPGKELEDEVLQLCRSLRSH